MVSVLTDLKKAKLAHFGGYNAEPTALDKKTKNSKKKYFWKIIDIINIVI